MTEDLLEKALIILTTHSILLQSSKAIADSTLMVNEEFSSKLLRLNINKLPKCDNVRFFD